MSLDHLGNSKDSEQILDDQSEEVGAIENYKYQINNMYNKEKYVNSHDIAGQPGIVKMQQIDVEKKKVQFRMANEKYLRDHPELNTIISVFLFRVLEEKPDNILAYAGRYFDKPDLKQVIEIEKKHYLDNNKNGQNKQ
ncbi:RIIa domain protein (macronuclear) [Tetrahymena thermophila SB210]|uniref:RIIa domain protein n=1 Tax=Tetrahymena thermophila (strain SB210) TaxID=312017 RepID=I7MLY6_TETTS|nr:RIIa domain protein [Tetrahymena thermophila SB210]EAS03302.1 RIIa domain protein [Tetrahymena thermophila SB210]|eukprot:XP_001023547.1 RIIa domain protein [Tetrahymena thermophila SB210]